MPDVFYDCVTRTPLPFVDLGRHVRLTTACECVSRGTIFKLAIFIDSGSCTYPEPGF